MWGLEPAAAAATATLVKLWGAALAEPTPIGEIVATVITIYVVVDTISDIIDEKKRDPGGRNSIPIDQRPPTYHGGRVNSSPSGSNGSKNLGDPDFKPPEIDLSTATRVGLGVVGTITVVTGVIEEVKKHQQNQQVSSSPDQKKLMAK